jgi:hypothetical protein
MKSVLMAVCVAGSLASAMIVAVAQEHASTSDPRASLKAGFYDAGEAARNMERVASMPKAKGFYDPKAPAGEPTPPERDQNGRGANNAAAPGSANAAAAGEAGAAGAAAGAAGEGGEPRDPNAPPPFDPKLANRLGFANSDLAFSHNHVFEGNYHGFNTYDVDSARRPKLLASVVCPGGQGDLSVYGHLLFMSVEQTRGRIDCGTQGNEQPVSKERFRGVRIFDISDLRNPKQIAAIQTCRGSHTHTVVVDPKDKDNVYIYGSGTSAVRPGEELSGCSSAKPEEDPNTSLYSIDVIQVPLAAPDKAHLVNKPRLFSDPVTGAIAGLEREAPAMPGTQGPRQSNQCHDITAYPAIGLAAGACAGNGILLDIRDPVHPVRLDAVSDKNFAYWHSATFNNDGTKVIFTDEWGGGARPRCRASDPLNWGADAIFDVVDGKLRFASYYKMPAAQTDQENCVAHNGSLVPVPGRDIMVQGWYQGGVSVFDFTDSAKPVEIAYFDRGPIDAKQLILGGFWSAYWYNGYIYGSEIARGLDIFRLTPSEYLSQNEIEAATQVRVDELNVQEQQQLTWPATSAVARAYLDQLTRTKAIQPERVRAVNAALDRAEGIRSNGDKGAAAAVAQIDAVVAQLQSDAAAATGRDAARLRALADTIKSRASKMR